MLDAHWATVSLAALGAACAVAFLSRTDGVVLAILLALTAWDGAIAAAALLVGLSVAGRIGTTALPALAGAQAVLGPAGIVGPPLVAGSAWCAAAALIAASPGGWAAVPFGLAAALMAEGPAATSPGRLFVRLLAMVAFVDAAGAAGRWIPRSIARPIALGLGLLALVLAIAGAPRGGFGWSHLSSGPALAEGALLLAAGIAVALVAPWVAARLRPSSS